MDDVVLGHVADHAPELPQVGVQVDAIEAHRSHAGRGDTSDRLQQHRLAGTAGTDDRDELTSRDRKRHGVQHRDLAPAADPNPSGQLVDVDAKPWGSTLATDAVAAPSLRRTSRSRRSRNRVLTGPPRDGKTLAIDRLEPKRTRRVSPSRPRCRTTN